MTAASLSVDGPAGTVPLRPLFVVGVLAGVLALRLMHVSSALQSPLSYQPGPDEDYYLRFGEAVAAGVGQDSAEFTFMDPAYGYLLGAVFKVLGVNVFAVYLLQALLDTATAFGLLTIGRLLGRPRAGLYGALLYGATSTAIMFCAALLKEIWVAAYLTWWVVGALAVLRSDRKLAWVAFGVFCGVGIALRSTLVLLGFFALLLPRIDTRSSGWAAKAGSTVLGLALALAPWSLRNYEACGGVSPLPHNGGIVLHQIYNVQNPSAAIWVPAFVNYLHPSEIWRGYAAEADKRAGHSLAPPAVDAYWRGEALAFMRQHPGQVLGDIVRKAGLFLADTEVPNNRSSAEERMFSPVLESLPAPMVWLIALGLVGVAWLASQDRRWPIIVAPIILAWITVAVFWAEDRFRFHAAPLLALGAGVWIDELLSTGRAMGRGRLPALVAAAALAALSVYLGRQYPPPTVRWDHVVWGYIKMGKLVEARTLAERIAVEQPDNAPIHEALGYVAASGQRYPEAVQELQRAIELRPRSYLAHYNLAKVFLALGDKQKAVAEAQLSEALSPSVDARLLLKKIEAMP